VLAAVAALEASESLALSFLLLWRDWSLGPDAHALPLLAAPASAPAPAPPASCFAPAWCFAPSALFWPAVFFSSWDFSRVPSAVKTCALVLLLLALFFVRSCALELVLVL